MECWESYLALHTSYHGAEQSVCLLQTYRLMFSIHILRKWLGVYTDINISLTNLQRTEYKGSNNADRLVNGEACSYRKRVLGRNWFTLREQKLSIAMLVGPDALTVRLSSVPCQLLTCVWNLCDFTSKNTIECEKQYFFITATLQEVGNYHVT